MIANPLKIAILEDSVFYNDLLTRKITGYTQTLEVNSTLSFEVRSYLDTTSCLSNLDTDTSILFLDYYLDNGKTAREVINQINRFALNCQIIILSQNKRSHIIDELMQEGIEDFIHKNDETLAYICLYIDKYLQKHLKK